MLGATKKRSQTEELAALGLREADVWPSTLAESPAP
jgi:hypothetical protein